MDLNELTVLLETQKAGCFSFECKEAIAKEIEELLMANTRQLGILSQEDAVYGKFSVKEYLSFFASLSNHKKLYQEAIQVFHLHDLLHVRLEKLTRSQLARVKAARELICDHEVLYLKDPFRDLEEQDIEIMLQWIDQLNQKNKQVFITSQTLKEVCMMPGKHFFIGKDKELQEITNLNVQEDCVQPLKISAKLNDKIMLFNPNEIDYIESLDGKSYLYVRNSSFVCTLTMEELENKLKQFGFYRCHRSYLVNMQKVVEIVKWTRNSYSLKLEHLDDVRIPLSKGRMEEMRELYEF